MLILVVEDEALIENLVVSGLEGAGYAVATARSAEFDKADRIDIARERREARG